MAKIALISNAQIKSLHGTPGSSILATIEHHGIDNAQFHMLPGFAGLPHDGGEGVVLDCQGNNIIIAFNNYALSLDIEKGESILYSYNASGTILASVVANKDGEIIINEGTKSAVSYAELNTALQLMVGAFNTALASKLDGSGAAGVVTLDISASEVAEVKLP